MTFDLDVFCCPGWVSLLIQRRARGTTLRFVDRARGYIHVQLHVRMVYACAALVCPCRDPPAARTGALYFANPLLALLNSRPAAWCPQHRSLQHIRCRWAVPYSSTGILGQHGQVGRPGTATHHAGGALLHACSAHGAGVYMCVRVGCAWHAEAKCAVECCY